MIEANYVRLYIRKTLSKGKNYHYYTMWSIVVRVIQNTSIVDTCKSSYESKIYLQNGVQLYLFNGDWYICTYAYVFNSCNINT